MCVCARSRAQLEGFSGLDDFQAFMKEVQEDAFRELAESGRVRGPRSVALQHPWTICTDIAHVTRCVWCVLCCVLPLLAERGPWRALSCNVFAHDHWPTAQLDALDVSDQEDEAEERAPAPRQTNLRARSARLPRKGGAWGKAHERKMQRFQSNRLGAGGRPNNKKLRLLRKVSRLETHTLDARSRCRRHAPLSVASASVMVVSPVWCRVPFAVAVAVRLQSLQSSALAPCVFFASPP